MKDNEATQSQYQFNQFSFSKYDEDAIAEWESGKHGPTKVEGDRTVVVMPEAYVRDVPVWDELLDQFTGFYDTLVKNLPIDVNVDVSYNHYGSLFTVWDVLTTDLPALIDVVNGENIAYHEAMDTDYQEVVLALGTIYEDPTDSVDGAVNLVYAIQRVGLDVSEWHEELGEWLDNPEVIEAMA